jgi:hypothetical protein
MVKINGSHPFWPICRLAVIFAGLTALLYINSSLFDGTEIKTIVELAFLAGGFEMVRRKLSQ